MQKNKAAHSIDDVQITNDLLTGRAGLNLFVKYLLGIELFPHVERMFGSMRKIDKGVPIVELFKQILCFFFDGTSRHLVWFDALAKDPGYAAVIETAPGNMASSHSVKRFFQAFSMPRIYLFRRLLLQLFLWRLRVTRPGLIELNIDTMVMDNDQAPKRHGVEPTYKNVLGFQPLQMTWGRYIIDAVFRGGSKHSNNGDSVRQMILHVVRLIRKRYSQNIPIIFRMDSGFCDQKLFAEMESLGVGYICAGTFHKDIKETVESLPEHAFSHHFGKTDEDIWQYCELGDRRSAWAIFRRAIFWRPLLEEKQFLLPGSRPGTLVYTNLGMGQTVDRCLEQAGLGYLLDAEAVIHSYHQRGADELVHRAFKDFAFEELPFLRFPPNAAFYSMMLLGFFFFEAFKEDVTEPVIPVTAYSTTLRRQVVDIAGKIVSHAGKTILKVTATTMNLLRFKDIWDNCMRVTVFHWA
jgi:hypothetical protein